MKIEIIDPPVTPFSPKAEIKAWIEYLKSADKPWSDERKEAIKDAKFMLKENYDINN